MGVKVDSLTRAVEELYTENSKQKARIEELFVENSKKTAHIEELFAENSKKTAHIEELDCFRNFCGFPCPRNREVDQDLLLGNAC